MSPQPTGRLIRTDDGVDLVLTRRLPEPVDEAWGWLTDSARTARWFASWSGDAAVGADVAIRLTLEEGEPESTMRITACEPPHRLAVTASDAFGAWRLEAFLTPDPAGSQVTFVHHLPDAEGIGSIGPGWEFYLDALVAAATGEPTPSFDDYHPAQEPHYREAAAAL